mmetsp:Transcript_9173/g.15746  ORF Transcript_9173/g.15746 Transcript_9173/m.15746 type:complete len:223 (-) Transcript_9173:64-732(-)
MLVEEMGADVRARNARGTTPLHVAAGNGHVATVRVLLKLGADGHARARDDGRTPLHRAASTGQAEVVRVMVEEMGIGAVDPRAAGDTTPLHWAASDTTPLDMATAGRHVETTSSKRVLVENGAKLHTQLFVAASGGQAETVRALLVETGTDAHTQHTQCTQYAYGFTPLHSAASGNSKGTGGDGERRACVGFRWTHGAAYGCWCWTNGNSKGTAGGYGGRRS